jgi:hypothetical protein
MGLLIAGGSLAASAPPERALLADVAAPTLLGMSLAPTTVNTGIRAHEIVITLFVMDLDSGVSGTGETEVRFKSPSGRAWTTARFYHGVPGAPDHLVEGTPQNGMWRASLTLPAQSEAGIWEMEYCFIADQAGNYALLGASDMAAFGFPYRFQVRNTIFGLRLPLVLRTGPPPTPTPIPSPLPTIPQGLPVPPSFPTPSF